MTATQYVILVNDNNQETGIAEKLAAHEQNLLHRAFSVFLFRKTPTLELLLQQRAADKYHCGGLWTNTCCSHPAPGEEIIPAGERRLKEELGISASLKDLGWFHYNAHFNNGLSEHEIDHVLIGYADANTSIVPNSDEIQSYQWVSLSTLENELADHPSQFTPWLPIALKMVKKYLGQS